MCSLMQCRQPQAWFRSACKQAHGVVQRVTARACSRNNMLGDFKARRSAAGSYGRALIDGDEASLGGVKGWQVGVAVAVTLVALLYMGRLAQQALDEAEQEEGASP